VIRLEVEVTPRSPLVIGSDRTYGLYNETRRYLPGSVLRGALAGLLLEGCTRPEYRHDHESCPDKDNCHFYTLFCRQPPPVFENCYPSRTDGPTYPLPLSARTCKDSLLSGHGVYDILVRQFVFERALEEGVALPFFYEPRCPKCGRGVSPCEGFYGRDEAGYYQVQAPLGRTSRTAINRRRAVAQDRMLYTLEVIQPPLPDADSYTALRGSVLIDEERGELLERVLPLVKRVGSGRSRGLGQVSVVIKKSGAPSLMPLAERLAGLNDIINEEWAFYNKLNPDLPPAEGWFFTVNLLAPALLTRHGLPTTVLEADELGLANAGIQLVRAFTGHEALGGWLMGAGLPRGTELSTAMGSVFLYQVRGIAQDELLDPLADLEQRGVGRERERGVGQVQVCSPFHLEVM
jgi:CRISPR-associated protein Csx10